MSGTVAICACLPVLVSGKTDLSAFVDSSLFLLTLVTPCGTGASEPEIKGDASGFYRWCLCFKRQSRGFS